MEPVIARRIRPFSGGGIAARIRTTHGSLPRDHASDKPRKLSYIHLTTLVSAHVRPRLSEIPYRQARAFSLQSQPMSQPENAYTLLIRVTEKVCQEHLGPTAADKQYQDFERWVLSRKSESLSPIVPA